MKYKIVLILWIHTLFIFSQKKVSKQFQTNANEINIYTAGLDNFVLENSTSDFVEVILIAESYDEQLIHIEHKNKEVNVKFTFKGAETREVVFRKFITKRLQRANVVVKVPKNKKVFVFGENVDVESKSFKNDVAIFIENGIVKLNKIVANTTLKLYSGNVYATVNKTNLDLKSNQGKIKLDSVIHQKKYKKNSLQNLKLLSVESIKANIYLSSN